MGQAKNRGSLADRIKQAKEKEADLIELTVSEAIEKMGIPKDAIFSGYVVHLPERDEFLANIEENDMMVKYAYAKTPILALKFEDVQEAIKIAKEIDKHKVYVCIFFEDDTRIWVNEIWANFD